MRANGVGLQWLIEIDDGRVKFRSQIFCRLFSVFGAHTCIHTYVVVLVTPIFGKFPNRLLCRIAFHVGKYFRPLASDQPTSQRPVAGNELTR